MIIPLIILNIIFYLYLGKKKGFDGIESFWLLYFSIFCYLLWKGSKFVIIFFLNPQLYFIVNFYISIIILFFSSKKETGLYNISQTIYPEISFNFEREIILTNYPSNYIGYFLPPRFAKKVCFVMIEDSIVFVKNFYPFDDLIGVKKGSFDLVKRKIKEKHERGYTIFAYFEKKYTSRKNKNRISDEVRTGMLSISKQLSIPIRLIKYKQIEHDIGFVDSFNLKIKHSEAKVVNDIPSFVNEIKEFYN